jgi:nitroreductase
VRFKNNCAVYSTDKQLTPEGMLLCVKFLYGDKKVEIQEVISQCRTIHSFNESKVSKEIILKGLEISLKAPNHKFTFPWKYYYLGDNSQRKLFEFVLTQKFDAAPSEEQLAGVKSKILNPTLVFFSQKHNPDPFYAKEDYATMACSVQLLALYLAEKGIGYKWSTAAFTRSDFTYELLGIDKEQEEIVGCIMIGHAQNAPKERNRPHLEDILVHCE